MDLASYLATAVKRQNVRSRAALAQILGINRSNFTHWSTGRALPDDETMLKLSRLAGVDPGVALIDLNIWRSEGDARQRYVAIRSFLTSIRKDVKSLAKTTLMLLFAFAFLCVSHSDASASGNVQAMPSVYYGKNRQRRHTALMVALRIKALLVVWVRKLLEAQCYRTTLPRCC